MTDQLWGDFSKVLKNKPALFSKGWVFCPSPYSKVFKYHHLHCLTLYLSTTFAHSFSVLALHAVDFFAFSPDYFLIMDPLLPTHEDDEEGLLEVDPSIGNRNSRGSTKLRWLRRFRKLGKKLVIKYNSKGQPFGKAATLLSSYLGVL
ncbi:hypothetical protein Dsin_012223 [Dipteronia sinensis]|uniref:Uncharacterized protein n=1 Tax=Dipteronia sinensis TaxID=43782 RepID=A0AAE0AI47_9ROSI|nr:hypothetical protein Dsin_012223 [Dipteronia sinensis]